MGDEVKAEPRERKYGVKLVRGPVRSAGSARGALR